MASDRPVHSRMNRDRITLSEDELYDLLVRADWIVSVMRSRPASLDERELYELEWVSRVARTAYKEMNP